MTGLLASVANLAEARLVVDAGVDIVDLKNPAAGALGALPLPTISAIASELAGVATLSATVGDLPMEPASIRESVVATASSGVNYVKLGFFPDGDWTAVIRELADAALKHIRLIAVLFGDLQPDIAILNSLAQAGFSGAMLDTADKRRGSLTAVCSPAFLKDFVAATHDLGLMCGLAGSLRERDIPALMPLRADYLGFRGALCHRHARDADLDVQQVTRIKLSMGAGKATEPRKNCFDLA